MKLLTKLKIAVFFIFYLAAFVIFCFFGRVVIEFLRLDEILGWI